MKHQNQRFWGIGVLACLFSILLSCSQPATPLRVGTVTWTGYEPLYLAQELGYYKNTSIQIINYPSATEVSRAYRNSELEVACLTLDEALLVRQVEPEFIAFLINDISQGADVLLGKPTLADLKSLKGKRIGVETSALGSYVLTRILQKAQLSPQDLEIVPLNGLAEHEQAFKQNQIDAVITYEPSRSRLIATGAKVLFDSREIPNEIVDLMATRQELLEDQANGLRILTKGWFQALDYLKENSEDAIRRMALRQQVSSEEFMQALNLIKIPNLQENQQLLSQDNLTLQQSAKFMSQVMVEKNLLQQGVDVETMFTDAVVKNL